MSVRAHSSDPMIGELIAGRYRIERQIGKGGMGTIYEVSHAKLGRRFALKTLAEDLMDNEEALTRFRREADVISRLKHPNIVEIVDWEELGGTPCIVMELLSGEPLADRLKRGPLSWEEIAVIADELLSALSVAHASGIVHRDLKPHNIFMAQDGSGGERAKLLDFGVSKITDSKTFATTDAKMLGTPAYMAPEQADGRQDQIGSKTDVWAMGAILFEMATGKQAFDAPSVPSILYRVCHGEPDDIYDHRSDVPEKFARLIERALSHGEDRIGDADKMRVLVRRALENHATDSMYSSSLSVAQVELAEDEAIYANAFDETVGGRPASVAVVAEEPPKRRGWLLAGLLVLAGAGGAGVGLNMMGDDGPSAQEKMEAAREKAAQERERKARELEEAERRSRLEDERQEKERMVAEKRALEQQLADQAARAKEKEEAERRKSFAKKRKSSTKKRKPPTEKVPKPRPRAGKEGQPENPYE